MENNDLLFNDEYEQFYLMSKNSEAFRTFCKKAFGQDFSQDGFSDVSQIDRAIKYIPQGGCILDIGCGNGKMLGYLQEKTGARICGFDYSSNAIDLATTLFTHDSDFKHGSIGEVDYPLESFDVITSMDSMYFAPDMSAFVNQIMGWLKPGGTFYVCYQEGDVMPKTVDCNSSVLAKAFIEKNISYECIDITRESYDLLLRKRKTAIECKELFKAEGNERWFEMLISQTDYANKPFDEYNKEMARYIYIVQK